MVYHLYSQLVDDNNYNISRPMNKATKEDLEQVHVSAILVCLPVASIGPDFSHTYFFLPCDQIHTEDRHHRGLSVVAGLMMRIEWAGP